jgi:hypothetical protein
MSGISSPTSVVVLSTRHPARGTPFLYTRTGYPCFSLPRMKSGSHAEASVPIGGYLCPSCSIRGPHVHHCSDGTLDITPATCLPQPHQVVLSGMC